MTILTVTNKRDSFRGLVIGRVTEAETIYTVVAAKYGGIWYKGDWQNDKWQFLREKAFSQRFPKLASETLDDPQKLAEIRRELDQEGLLAL